uniref:Carotene hydroxylase n=1 Tax=Euglena gracilis TaxID=3039 RepID=A0A1Y1C3J7_EUGGR|nr:carotene hydroxylase [Euglena gracilis]
MQRPLADPAPRARLLCAVALLGVALYSAATLAAPAVLYTTQQAARPVSVAGALLPAAPLAAQIPPPTPVTLSTPVPGDALIPRSALQAGPNSTGSWAPFALPAAVLTALSASALIIWRNLVGRRREEALQPLAMFAAEGARKIVDQNVANKGKGLPFWWQYVWQLPFTQSGPRGTPLVAGDTMQIFKHNIEQIYADMPSVDGAPLAEGDLSDLTDGTMFKGLKRYFENFGSVYKLCFGPKSFIVVSDPLIAKWILTNNQCFDKGVLAEILEDIMGKGLIPADPETWKTRRRALSPAFHKAWLDRMTQDFGRLSLRMCEKLKGTTQAVDMEERFGSLALDIIGKAVFNYDFQSSMKESAVVKAAISTLKEAEHRSMTPLPYWKLPLADVVVPRQADFKRNMALINDQLNLAIASALKNRDPADIADLEARDYDEMDNPSLLRILVDMRGEETTNQQLRDDLITLLIAGHETTASALTWAIFELTQQPELLRRVQREVDEVLGDRLPTMDDIRGLLLCRLCIAESLRMYPEPPLLIRRVLDDLTLPKGATAKFEATLKRATDIFLAIYNIHHDGRFWPNPDFYDPERFLRPYKNPEIPEWKGYDPEGWKGRLYPDEVSSDYAFMPFGAGPRRCLGDVFATLEGTVALAMVLRRFDFAFAAPTAQPDQVGMATGATIHTRNGLWMTLTPRATAA